MRRALYVLIAASLFAALPIGAQPREHTVTIGASGDLLAHLKVIESARTLEGGFTRVLAGVRGVAVDNEIAFVNLETPLSMRIPPVSADPPILGAPAEIAAALAAVGVDVVSVANNHAYDQGSQGLADTLVALAEAHVLAVGADAEGDQAPGPRLIERDGVRVAFLAFTERVNRGPAARHLPAQVSHFDRELAVQKLAQARAAADLVVVSMHWSHDYVMQPLIAQRRLARFLVENGADVILGHGPHVLQEVERLQSPRGEAVCAYSLGNFISNQGLRWGPGRVHIPEGMHPAVILPETRDGVWLRIRARVGERIAIEALSAVPLWTYNDTATRPRHAPIDIHLQALSEADPRVREERRPVIARALGSEVTIAD